MTNSLYALALIFSALFLSACSDSAPPAPKQAEAGQVSAADSGVVQALHDPLDKAKSVAPLVQDAADANRRQIEEQSE